MKQTVLTERAIIPAQNVPVEYESDPLVGRQIRSKVSRLESAQFLGQTSPHLFMAVVKELEFDIDPILIEIGLVSGRICGLRARFVHGCGLIGRGWGLRRFRGVGWGGGGSMDRWMRVMIVPDVGGPPRNGSDEDEHQTREERDHFVAQTFHHHAVMGVSIG